MVGKGDIARGGSEYSTFFLPLFPLEAEYKNYIYIYINRNNNGFMGLMPKGMWKQHLSARAAVDPLVSKFFFFLSFLVIFFPNEFLSKSYLLV